MSSYFIGIRNPHVHLLEICLKVWVLIVYNKMNKLYDTIIQKSFKMSCKQGEILR